MSRETPRWRSVALQLLKVGVSVGLLVWLFRQVDAARLWAAVRAASWAWLGVAALLYFAMLVVSSWRWNMLLRAQGIAVRLRTLIGSFLVATFFNNFLPSNIGGDVVRIRDTAGPANSRTLATTIVLVDRGLGLLALVLVAALGASASQPSLRGGPARPAVDALGRPLRRRRRLNPGAAGAGARDPAGGAAASAARRLGRPAAAQADGGARSFRQRAGGARVQRGRGGHGPGAAGRVLRGGRAAGCASRCRRGTWP